LRNSTIISDREKGGKKFYYDDEDFNHFNHLILVTQNLIIFDHF